MRHSICVALFCLLVTGSALAQDHRTFRPCQWDGANLVVFGGSSEDPSALAQVLNPKGDLLKRIPRCPRPGSKSSLGGPVAYANGSFYYGFHHVAITPEGKSVQNEVHRFNGKSWVREAVFTGTSLVDLYPLEEGRFLGISLSPEAFKSNGKSFPFAVLQQRADGTLDLAQCLDAGLEKPFFTAKGTLQYPALQKDFMSISMARTPSHYVLASGFGLFWTFDAAKGSLAKVLRLHGGLTDARLEKGDLMPGLLGFQPTREGEILISGRAEDAVLEAFAKLGDADSFARNVAGQSPEASKERFANAWKQHQDLLVQMFPEILWWRIDLNEGKVNPTYPPQNITNHTTSSQAALDFNWRFKPDGNLLLKTKKEVDALATSPWD